MKLDFAVKGLHVEQTESEYTVNDNQNLIKAYFSFDGEMWTTQSVKTALFHYNNTAYAVILDDDWCYVPVEVLRGEFFSVGITTSYEQNSVSVNVYSDLCEVRTNKSCYAENTQNGVSTLSELQQLLNLIAQIRAEASGYATEELLAETLGGVDVPSLKRQVMANLAGIEHVLVLVGGLESFDNYLDRQISLLTAGQTSITSDVDAITQRVLAVETTISELADSFDDLNGEVI